MEENIDYNYKEEKVRLFTSKSRNGVRPTKTYPFEENAQKEQINKNQNIFNQGQDYEKEFEEHFEKCKGMISITQEEKKQLIDQYPRRVKNVDQYPYSAVGILWITSKKHKIILQHGTGSLIGPNLVLTVFHNCVGQKMNEEDIEIEFVPSPIHRRRGGDSFKVINKYLPKQAYQMLESKQLNKGNIYDFAVLELDWKLNLEQYFGSLGYNFNTSSYTLRKVYKNMQLLGYPKWKKLTEFKGSAFCDKYYFITTMLTQKGVSGGPLIMQKEEKDKNIQLIGLHVAEKKSHENSKRIVLVLKLQEEMFEAIADKFEQTLHSYDCSNHQIIQATSAKAQGIF